LDILHWNVAQRLQFCTSLTDGVASLQTGFQASISFARDVIETAVKRRPECSLLSLEPLEQSGLGAGVSLGKSPTRLNGLHFHPLTHKPSDVTHFLKPFRDNHSLTRVSQVQICW
jgi:hypothetical protein